MPQQQPSCLVGSFYSRHDAILWSQQASRWAVCDPFDRTFSHSSRQAEGKEAIEDDISVLAVRSSALATHWPSGEAGLGTYPKMQ